MLGQRDGLCLSVGMGWCAAAIEVVQRSTKEIGRCTQVVAAFALGWEEESPDRPTRRAYIDATSNKYDSCSKVFLACQSYEISCSSPCVIRPARIDLPILIRSRFPDFGKENPDTHDGYASTGGNGDSATRVAGPIHSCCRSHARAHLLQGLVGVGRVEVERRL